MIHLDAQKFILNCGIIILNVKSKILEVKSKNIINYKFTNLQIYKFTNLQIYKFTNYIFSFIYSSLLFPIELLITSIWLSTFFSNFLKSHFSTSGVTK